MRQKFVLIMLTGMMTFGGMFVCVARADAAEEFGAGNMVSFRGGWAALTSNRANEVFTDTFGNSMKINNGSSGYYVGGALDLLLSHDIW